MRGGCGPLLRLAAALLVVAAFQVPPAPGDAVPAVVPAPLQVISSRGASLREAFGFAQVPSGGEPIRVIDGQQFTEAEAATVIDRLAFQQQVTRSAPLVKQALRESFAGMWFDPKSGTADVAVIGAAPPIEGIEALTGLPGQRTRLHQVARSMAQLEALQDQLGRESPSPGYKLIGSAIDQQRNQVIVHASGDLHEVASDLASYGGAVAVQAGKDPLPMNASRSNPGNPPKWEAGMRIYPTTNTPRYCTAAFRVMSGSSSVALTAGHCGPVGPAPFGTEWKIGSSVVGDTLVNPWYNGCGGGGCRDADAQAISVNAPGDPTWTLEPDCVYLAPNNCHNLDAFGDPVQGSIVCGSGAGIEPDYHHPDSYEPCYIVESVNFSTTHNGTALHDFATARILSTETYCLAYGDSGTPFYEKAPAAWPGIPERYTAVGIFWGGNGDCTGTTGQIAYISRWSRIKTRLGELGLTVSEPEVVAQPRLQTGAAYNPNGRLIWLFTIANGRLMRTKYDQTPNNPSSWFPWAEVTVPNLANYWYQNPAPLVNADNRVEVAGLATNYWSNPYEVHAYVLKETSLNGSWALTDLGKPAGATFGSFTNVVLAKVEGDKNMVMAADGSGVVWYKIQTSPGSWAGATWQNLSGYQPMAIYSGLAAAKDANGLVEVFGISDIPQCWCGYVQRATRSPSGQWSNWAALSPPSPAMLWTSTGMTTQNSSEPDFYATSSQGQVWRTWRLGGSWTGWANFGWSAFAGVSAALGGDHAGPGNRYTYVFGSVGPIYGEESQEPQTMSYYARLLPGLGWTNWCPTGDGQFIPGTPPPPYCPGD